jgi:hypothetical protein
MPRTNPTKRPRLNRVSIRAERHDQPDWDRFAWALLQYTKTLSKKPLPPKAGKGKPSP